MDFLNEMGLIPNYRKKDIALFNVDCLKLMEEMKERLYWLYCEWPTIQINKKRLWKTERAEKNIVVVCLEYMEVMKIHNI